jgi:hypothetical protein
MYSIKIDGFQSAEEAKQYIEWLSAKETQTTLKLWWLWHGYGLTGFNPSIVEISDFMINHTALVTVSSKQGDTNA